MGGYSSMGAGASPGGSGYGKGTGNGYSSVLPNWGNQTPLANLGTAPAAGYGFHATGPDNPGSVAPQVAGTNSGLPPGIQTLMDKGFQFGNNAGLPAGLQNFGGAQGGTASGFGANFPTQPGFPFPGQVGGGTTAVGTPTAPLGNPFGTLGNPFGAPPTGGVGGQPSWLAALLSGLGASG